MIDNQKEKDRPAAAKKPLRVFLADDHAIVRDGLKLLINAQPDMNVVGEAEDGRTTFERIRVFQGDSESSVDIVVMDIAMPEGNGTETTARIKQQWPEIHVLALSMHENKSYLRSLLEAGVSGYVLKRSAAEDLIHAIRVVASGGTYLDQSLAATVAEELVRSSATFRRSLRSDESVTLSEREEEVLRLVSQGYTNKEVGAKLFLSVKTIETYKARSMEKLGLNSRADIIRYAVACGWLSKPE